MNKNSVGLESWCFLSCCVLLCVGYASHQWLPLAMASGVATPIGWLVAPVCVAFGMLYLIGDGHGRNWLGSLLPFLAAYASFRLAFL